MSDLPDSAKKRISTEVEFGKIPYRDIDLDWGSLEKAIEKRNAEQVVRYSRKVQANLRVAISDLRDFQRLKRGLGVARYCVCKQPKEWKTAALALDRLKKKLDEEFIKITPVSRDA